MEEMRAYREVIHENIDYQYHAKEDVDELVELIIEVMMMPEDSMIRIAGVEKPVALVKSRFMKLNYSHIEYVLFCLNRNTTKVGNIKAYLLTAQMCIRDRDRAIWITCAVWRMWECFLLLRSTIMDRKSFLSSF